MGRVDVAKRQTGGVEEAGLHERRGGGRGLRGVAEQEVVDDELGHVALDGCGVG